VQRWSLRYNFMVQTYCEEYHLADLGGEIISDIEALAADYGISDIYGENLGVLDSHLVIIDWGMLDPRKLQRSLRRDACAMSMFRAMRSGGHLWKRVSCSCCGGLEWGDEEPRECSTCFGSGMFYVNRHGTGVLWPGGPFNGVREPKLWREPWAWLRVWTGTELLHGRDALACRCRAPS
jgi:hypothetical protein